MKMPKKLLLTIFMATLAILATSFNTTNTIANALPMPLELFRQTEPKSFRQHIPSERNWRVEQWISHFARRDRERFDRYMTRGALYKTLIQDILVEHGVPADLYYLAMIESGFSRRARSRAQAVGFWQFIAPTARRYGLKVNNEVDERMDIIRSTRAAARYLKDLHNEFGDWYLAMAAYNCGEARVRRVVRRHGTKNFWVLARRRALPIETINYVPKFQAARKIAKSPESYGFQRKTFYQYPVVRKVRVQENKHLASIARQHGVRVQTLLALNPQLITSRTPSTRSGYYEIWLPKPRNT